VRFILPQPIHGWRAFWGEVGIIVLGVLIALAAQQVVETVNWRREVAGFRETVREEMAINLGSYPYRAKQKRCITARLDELQRWLDGWRVGERQRLVGPIGMPASRVIRTSAWDSRDPDTFAHMPRKEKVEYGFLYSEFANNEVHRLDERDTWIALAGFDGATMLDHQDQMRLQGLITRARLRDGRIDDNAQRFLKRAARDSGLQPQDVPDPPAYDPNLCKPILVGASTDQASKTSPSA
jgi:hypothetical protein